MPPQLDRNFSPLAASTQSPPPRPKSLLSFCLLLLLVRTQKCPHDFSSIILDELLNFFMAKLDKVMPLETQTDSPVSTSLCFLELRMHEETAAAAIVAR